MRCVFKFGKTARLMCISHLDLQRFMQMALRRTDLPVAYSQGFNPHPILSFASALAMGVTSSAELMDVKMEKDVTEDFALSQMNRALPPDLPLIAVRAIDDQHPALMALLRMADYRIDLPESAAPIAEAVDDFLAEEHVIAIRKTKSGEKPTDIRPLSVVLASKETEIGYEIRARLMLTERDTLKPSLLLETLSTRAGVALPQGIAIHRIALLGEDASGNPKDLFAL